MDNELKEVLFNIQDGIIGLSNRMDKLDNQIDKVKDDVASIKLTLENETNKKIDVLYDGRIDEIRHREEFVETIATVENLQVRVDNLEKAFTVAH